MRRAIWIGMCIWTPLILASAIATAQVPTYQYAVKFVCAAPEAKGETKGSVAPGRYFTAINIHNPNPKGLSFKAKVAVALPGGKQGPVSKYYESRLGPDEALEIECQDIAGQLEKPPHFLKGFFVIDTSGMQLDVVAVYTAAGSTGLVETMQVERVSPRTMR